MHGKELIEDREFSSDGGKLTKFRVTLLEGKVFYQPIDYLRLSDDRYRCNRY